MFELPASPKQILEKHTHLITLFPGLSEQELDRFRKRLGGYLPAEINELLIYSTGFIYAQERAICFTGHEDFAFEEAFPCSIAVLPDGLGNFWVVDINKEDGAWGPVFYVCHDPAVVVVQAPELASFLLQVLQPLEGVPKNALDYVSKKAAFTIWRQDPWLMPYNDPRIPQDPLVSDFAKQLLQNCRIADLRRKEIGSGFRWGASRGTAQIWD
ncbi:MAG: hypothetical protein C4520_03090 [Candidatus Abyssobacteria bacterium SURF_5]|uniref:Knr4/Smi1-like domain-containing protein n=1 Tax=Abyssobacteria bacterium (strain SURF_5) TaxID=2093360 RepID=A0A3A4NX03_ABYX5|nr:MAG: hypothetical protein C4520_03090 [Candidatus Abyssubacteria bacterium SURF_5]